jgi:hypothetical protein
VCPSSTLGFLNSITGFLLLLDGYRLQPEFSSRSRSRCSEGGFGLWLGDEGIVVVKRAHNPLYSNRLWAHAPFSQPKTLEGNITARY